MEAFPTQNPYAHSNVQLTIIDNILKCLSKFQSLLENIMQTRYTIPII